MRQDLVVLLVCLVAATAHGASLRVKSGVHSDLCWWGPQYWCSSKQTAQRCGKTQYCVDKEWTRDIIRDNKCIRIQDVIKSARKGLESQTVKQMSDQDVALLLARVCSADKDMESRLLCKDIVTDRDILLKLIKLVPSKLPTMSAAIAVGGCRRQEPKQNVKCTTECESVLKTLQMSVGRVMTREHYMDMFKPLCAKTGMAHTVCEAMAHDNYEQFVQGITSVVPTQMCPKTSKCMDKPTFSSRNKGSFSECSECKYAVNEVRALSRNSEVQDAIRTVIKSACTHLGEFKDLCDTLADQGLSFVMELVVSEMEPEVICERLTLCKDPESKALLAPVEQKSTLKCTFCTLIMGEIDNFIKNDKRENLVVSVLEKFCTKVPSSINKECKAFVNEYGKLLLDLLATQLEPSHICPVLKLCEGKAALDFKRLTLPKLDANENELCEICEVMINLVDGLLKENSTEEEVKSLLGMVCNELPGLLKTECNSLLTQYFPLIQSFLEKGFPAKQACQAVKMCPASGFNRLPVPKFDDSADELCELCEYIVTYLDSLLKKNSTVEEVKTLLTKVCNELSGLLKTECNSLLTKYFPLIQSFLEKGFLPKQACQGVKMCPAPVVTMNKPSKVRDSTECYICKSIVTEVTHVLSEKSTKVEIDAALEKVCKILPASDRDSCTTIIDTYAPLIVQLMAEELDPTEVCTLLKLCAHTEGNKITSLRKENAALCPICEFAMQKLDDILKENSTQEEIKAALEQVCQLLPSTLKSECDTLIEQYFPMLIQLLLSESPSDVCKMLGLCSQAMITPKIMGVRKENAALCPICEFAMQKLDDILKQNSTQEEIKAALEQVCQLLPSTLKSECDTLIEQYFPMLIQLLLSESPSDVCKLLGLCSQAMITPKAVEVRKDGTLCVLCEFAMQELDNILKENSTQQQIEAALDQVCGLLPSTLKSECDSLIQQYFPMLIQLLLSESPSDVCKLLGLCSQVVITPKAVEVRKDGTLCVLCEFAMQELDNILKENSTQQQIEAALDQVCGLLPSTLKSECDSLIKQYFPMLIQLLLSESPSDVCKLLGLCSQAERTPKVMEVRKDGTLCVLCEFAMQELDNILKENSTQQQIEAALDQVCGLLPSTLKSECDSLIQQYFPMLIQLLLSESPSDVCKLLGLCSQVVITPKAVGVRKEKAALCPICEFAMQELDNILKENSTQQQIKAALDQVCDLLPSTLKSECDSLITQYTPVLIQLLLSQSPSDVCKLLGLCSDNLVASKSMIIKKEKADLCPICKLVIEQLDNFLKQNSTEQEIEAALDQVCQFLPDTLRAECDSLVKEYTPVMIQLLLAYSPNYVCQLAGLCPNTTTTRQVQMLKTSPLTVKKQKADLCPICELVIGGLESFLKENSTEQEIEAALEKVCGILPATVKTECDSLVQQYTPVLIQLLLNYSPSDVCKLAGLCTGTQKVQMLKTSPLTVKNEKADLCPICELVIGGLESFLKKNSTEQEIEVALEKVCGILPATVKAECDSLVQQYTPVLIQLLLNYSPSDVCKLAGLCTGTQKVQMPKTSPLTVKKEKADLCPICELVIGGLESFLKKNSTEQEIEVALEKVCGILPATVKTECDSLVETYTPILIQLLLNYSPSDVCKLAGLCTSTQQVKTLPVSGVKKESADALCTICEFAMSKLDQILQQNSTEQEIEAALEVVCNLLPSSIKSECDTLVKQYAPFIVQLLVSNLQPKQVCTALALCPKAPRQKVPTITKPIAVKKGEFCPICILVFTQVDKMLDSNSTKQQAIAVLDKVCDELPSAIKDECNPFVARYLPYVIDLVVQKFTPESICQTLNLCTTRSFVEAKPQALAASSRVKESELCSLCQYVLQYVDNVLSESSTEAEIEAALDKVCDVVPSNLKSDCEALIKEFAPQIIAYIVKGLAPHDICVSIGFCNAHDEFQQKEKVGADECKICETVLFYMDTLLKDKPTQEEIKSVLTAVCGIIPSTYKDDCNKYIKQYYEEIVELLLDFPASEICRLINLCPKNKLAKRVEVSKVNADGCEICQTVLMYVDEILKDKPTQEEIESVLTAVCDIVPSSYKADCNKYIKQYYEEIVELLLDFPASEICRLINLCPNNMKLHSTLELKCDLCEMMVRQLETMITSTSTQDEIETAVEKVCGLLPSNLKKDCDDLVETYTPTLIQLLMQELKPRQVCIELGLCSNDAQAPKTVKMVAITKPALKVKDGECELCTTVMSELDSMLSDESTQEEIRNALDFVCTRLLPQSISEECVNLVNTYEPLIIQFLTESYSPKDICTLLGLCKSSSKPAVEVIKMTTLTQPSLKVKDDEYCDLCTMVMSELDSLISDKSSQQEILNALDFVCTRVLPQSISEECVNLVNTYEPLIIEFLTQSYSPKELCSLMGLCQSSSHKQGNLPKLPPMTVRSGPLCPLCELVAQNLDKMLQQNSTQKDIEQALETVCNLLPSTLKDKCVSFVDLFTPQIVDFLVKEMSPDVICKQLKLCDSGSNELRVPAPENKKLSSGLTCDLCEMVIRKLKSELSSQPSEAEIEAALNKICSLIPESYQAECEYFIQKYTIYIIKLMLNELTAEKICQELALCDASSLDKVQEKKESSNGLECDLCEMVISKLKSEVTSQSSEAEIESYLEKICDLLPESLKAECESFVEEYTPLIVKLVLQDLTAQEICQKMGLCDAKAQEKKESSNGLTCDLCEMVISKLKSEVSSQSSEAEIESALEKICDVLPESLKAECESFVEEYTPLIVKLVLQDLTAQEICQKMGLCDAQERKEVSNFLTCDLCEMVVGKLKSEISSKSSQAEIKAALQKICSELPDKFQKECDTFVYDYLPLLLELFAQEITAKEICQKMGLCDASNTKVMTAITKPETVQGPTCVLCELVINKLKSTISTQTSEAQIESALKEVCSLLPESFESECDSLVDGYADTIIKLILADVSADQICKELGLCSSSTAIRVDVTSVEGCTLCEFVLEEVKGFVQKKSTVMEITALLQQVCHELPSELSTPCIDLAIMYGPNLVDFLTGKIAPKRMCQLVHVCPPPKTMEVQAEPLPQAQAPPQSLSFNSENELQLPVVSPTIMPDCSACKFSLYEVQTALGTSFWQDESPKILNLLCDRIQKWPDVCRFMVTENLPKLIADARGFRFPEEFCQDLKLCEPPKPTNVVNLSSFERCQLCNNLVGHMSSSNAGNSMDSTSMCDSIVPQHQKPHCTSLAGDYGHVLMGLWQKHQDPLLVCQTVDICPKMPVPNASVVQSKKEY